MKVVFSKPDGHAPSRVVREAALHFEDGILDGLRLVGFRVWRGRNGSDEGFYVTLPARQLWRITGPGEHGGTWYELLRTVGSGQSERLSKLKAWILEEFGGNYA